MIFGLRSVLQAVYLSQVYRGKIFFFPLSVFNSTVILNRCYHMDFYLLRSYEGSFIADLDVTQFCFILLVTDTR